MSEEKSIPGYFYVKPFKFFVLSVLTSGLYSLYWGYRNWDAIKVFDKSDISPFWRASLFILFGAPLLKRISGDLQGKDSFIYKNSFYFFLAIILVSVSDIFITKYFDFKLETNLVETILGLISSVTIILVIVYFQTLAWRGLSPVQKNKLAHGEKVVLVLGVVFLLFSILETISYIFKLNLV